LSSGIFKLEGFVPRKNKFHFVRVDTNIYESLNTTKEDSEYRYMPVNTYIETILNQYLKSRQGKGAPSSLEISPWIVERIEKLCEKEKEIFSVYINRILGEFLRQSKDHPATSVATDSQTPGTESPTGGGDPPPMGFRSMLINGTEYVPAGGYIHAPVHVSPVLQRDKEIANRIMRASKMRIGPRQNRP
jgi:hypothetical protein